MQLQGIAHLKKADPILGEIISVLPTPEIESTGSVFHDLMSCILEQQIHYRSTKRIFHNMLDRSGLTLLTPNNYSEFEERAFEGIKLSVNKYETVLRIVEQWETEEVKWEVLSDDAVKNKLSEIKGIGKWTIEMILIFTLNRPDVFAFDDFHIKQLMVQLYGLDPKSKLKAQMVEVAEPWAPYRSTAFRYLLEWKKFTKSNPT